MEPPDHVSSPLLQTYADAVSAQGAPLNNCFGFIDGAFRPICRPVELQGMVYNVKIQSLTVPSGLIANLFKPVGTSLKVSLTLVTAFNNSILLAQNFTLDKKKERKNINEDNEAKEIL